MALALSALKAQYLKDGYVIWPGILNPAQRRTSCRAIFDLLGVHTPLNSDVDPLIPAHAAALARFQGNSSTYQSLLHQISTLLSIQSIATSESVLRALDTLDLTAPTLATPPICYFVGDTRQPFGLIQRSPAHQDWRYMQGSLDALTLWLPFHGISEDLAPLEVIPGSHRRGLLPTAGTRHDLQVHPEHYSESDFITLELEAGDALLFSCFLIHRSGLNTSERLRMAIAFRYNNLQEPSYKARGYPSPYRFEPDLQLKRPNFPGPEDLSSIFG